MSENLNHHQNQNQDLTHNSERNHETPSFSEVGGQTINARNYELDLLSEHRQKVTAQQKIVNAYDAEYLRLKNDPNSSPQQRIDALERKISSLQELKNLYNNYQTELQRLDPEKRYSSPPDSIKTSSPESHESIHSAADQVLDRVLDRQCQKPGENYFDQPEYRAKLLGDVLKRPRKEAWGKIKTQFNDYISTRFPKYQALAKNTFDTLFNRVDTLSNRTHQVGDDTIKVFIDSDCLTNDWGTGTHLLNYRNLQNDSSRAQGYNWMDGPTTDQHFRHSATGLAQFAYAQNGDTSLQEFNDVNPYIPSGPLPSSSFIHANSNQTREGNCIRCYITSDKTKDPSLVLDAWRESLADSPLKTALYYKFSTSLEKDDKRPQRPDDIVIYKYDNIDDHQFKTLLEDFQQKCQAKAPNLLASQDSQMPATTVKIADGISIAAEPDFPNDILRCTDHKNGRHSWTTFIDRISMLSTLVASRRLGINPDSIDAPGLREETHRVFREFMLLSGINPDTMLQNSLGDRLPSWTQLNSST